MPDIFVKRWQRRGLVGQHVRLDAVGGFPLNEFQEQTKSGDFNGLLVNVNTKDVLTQNSAPLFEGEFPTFLCGLV